MMEIWKYQFRSGTISLEGEDFEDSEAVECVNDLNDYTKHGYYWPVRVFPAVN